MLSDLMMAGSPHTLSLQQTLKGVETKIQFLGSAPHNAKQAEELETLTKLKQTLLEQIQGQFLKILQLALNAILSLLCIL